MLARIAAGAALLPFAMALLSTAILAQPVPIAAREGLLKEVGGTHVSEPPSIRSGLVPPRIITADQIRSGWRMTWIRSATGSGSIRCPGAGCAQADRGGSIRQAAPRAAR